MVEAEHSNPSRSQPRSVSYYTMEGYVLRFWSSTRDLAEMEA